MGAPQGHRGSGLSARQIWLAANDGPTSIPAGGQGNSAPETILLPVAGFEWFRVIMASFAASGDPGMQFADMFQLFLNFYDSADNFIDDIVIATSLPISTVSTISSAFGAVCMAAPTERINIAASLFPAGVAKFSINGHANFQNPSAGALTIGGTVRGLVEVL